jgi:hypothetical protein
MSHFRFSSKPAIPTAAAAAPKPHHIQFEIVPVPTGTTSEFDPKFVAAQTAALKEFRERGKDIFKPNDCRMVSNGGNRAYETFETYGTALTVEKMVEVMNTHHLTLKVKFNRPGLHGANTCMELSAGLLDRLLQESPDAKNNKTIALRIGTEKHTAVPPHGTMYVTVAQQGAQHVLSHVDYHILAQYDELYSN